MAETINENSFIVIMSELSREKEQQFPRVQIHILYIRRTLVEHELLLTEQNEKFEYGISVVMPCYNVQNYVRETITSVFAQTFTDFELICIDDASTDTTLEILKEIATDHVNMTVIADENHGVGYQRNQGIQRARGKYVYYMDSDDLLKENCFQRIFDCAESSRLDLLYFEGTALYENENLRKRFPAYETLYNRKQAYPKIYNGEELYVKLRKAGDFIVQPCLQFIRREFLIENNLHFPDVRLFEDNEYTLKTILKAKRVTCIPDVLFLRRVRENSLVTAEGIQEKKAKEYGVVLHAMLQVLSEYTGKPEIYETMSQHIQMMLQMVARQMNGKSNGNHLEILEQLPSVSFSLFYSLWSDRDTKFRQACEERTEISLKLNESGRKLSDFSRKLHTKDEKIAELYQKLEDLQERNKKLYEKDAQIKELYQKLEVAYEHNKRLYEKDEKIRELNEKLENARRDKKELEKEWKVIKESRAYKLGNALLFLPRKVMSLFK